MFFLNMLICSLWILLYQLKHRKYMASLALINTPVVAVAVVVTGADDKSLLHLDTQNICAQSHCSEANEYLG